MTVEELNDLVEAAYAAAFQFLEKLTAVYEAAYLRQTAVAAERFEAATMTAAWTPPEMQSLSDGMSPEEVEDAEEIRDFAAAAIALVLASTGIAATSSTFMAAINARAQENFEQEILRQLRTIVSGALEQGLSAGDTASLIRTQMPQVIPSSADMLAQTELTSLVNERALAAANTQFRGVSKTWLTVGDNRVRSAHANAQGQTVPVDQPFSVGGAALMFPGDPAGPLRLVARCRCRLSFTDDPTAVVASSPPSTVTDVSAQEETMSSTTEFLPIYGSSGKVIGWSNSSLDNEIVQHLVDTIHLPASADARLSTVTISVEEAAAEEVAETGVLADGPAWRSLLCIEGVPTEDGRMLAEGSLTWRDLPLTLTAMDTSMHGAEGEAKVAGRIDRIWRDETNPSEIWGEGFFNGNEFGLYIASLVSNQSLRGNSIEPAVISAELWDRETMTKLSDDEALEALVEGRSLLTVFTEAIIMASTVVATPAIGDANIVLASGAMRPVFFTPFRVEETITASAAGMAPLEPPAEWFGDQRLQKPTPLTITDEGQVFGHVALWNTCHIGEPNGPGVCVPPPRSGMNYEIFHHGVVRTAEGHDVPVGQLTLGTNHAGRDLGWKAAMEHYDNSGLAFADVHVHEDRHGIAACGALRPDVPAVKVREARAGALSGDWRSVIGRGLEFIAALVVNVPGFPIPRPSAAITASGGMEEVTALLAAGMVEPAAEVDGMSRREYLRRIHSLTS